MITITEQVVSDEANTTRVKVRRERGAHIYVTWACGDTFRFTPEEVEHYIDVMERMRKHPDVWTRLKDFNGSNFTCHIDESGNFAADTQERDSARRVPWADLRKALKATL